MIFFCICLLVLFSFAFLSKHKAIQASLTISFSSKYWIAFFKDWIASCEDIYNYRFGNFHNFRYRIFLIRICFTIINWIFMYAYEIFHDVAFINRFKALKIIFKYTILVQLYSWYSISHKVFWDTWGLFIYDLALKISIVASFNLKVFCYCTSQLNKYHNINYIFWICRYIRIKSLIVLLIH